MVLVFYKPLVLAGHLALVMHFLHAGQARETLPCAEEPMTTVEFITALFDHVDEQLRTVPKHPEAHLSVLANTSWVIVIFGENHYLTGRIARGPSPEVPCSS
jgi:hypothetical protein